MNMELKPVSSKSLPIQNITSSRSKCTSHKKGLVNNLYSYFFLLYLETVCAVCYTY